MLGAPLGMAIYKCPSSSDLGAEEGSLTRVLKFGLGTEGGDELAKGT